MSTVATEPNPNGTQAQLQAQRLPAAQPRREIRVVEDDGPIAFLMDTARFEHMQRIANLMASASLLPDHLRGKGEFAQQQTAANCFLVVNQALRWKMDPFAVAPETYSVGGKLAFQGKLVAALVNTRAGLKKNLDYQFSGSGNERTLRVVGEFQNESAAREAVVVLKDVRTKNDMWTKDPDQKLIYTGAIKWARRHCPEVLLGVLTDDDVDRIQEREAIDVRPEPRRERPTLDALADRLAGSSEAASENAREPSEESQEAPLAPGEIASDLSRFQEICLSATTIGEVKKADESLRGPDGRTLTDDEAVLADAWKQSAVDRIHAGRGERSNKQEQKSLTD